MLFIDAYIIIPTALDQSVMHFIPHRIADI